MGRDTVKTVRRTELLARLELLDGMIHEEATRADLIREMGWDTTPIRATIRASQGDTPALRRVAHAVAARHGGFRC